MADLSAVGFPTLRGRGTECALLDGVVAAIRTSESRTLVLHGSAGIGKTALLNYVAASAADMRLLRATGVESADGACVRVLAPALCTTARSRGATPFRRSVTP